MLFSEPKIPQSVGAAIWYMRRRGFSALQRAENSSIRRQRVRAGRFRSFQCSSASRKFLNCGSVCACLARARFQCSSASRKFLNLHDGAHRWGLKDVSVLFSEPKIPQFSVFQNAINSWRSVFQCSSASRKFLNFDPTIRRIRASKFQCSSASRKFLNPDPRTCVHPYFRPR